MRDRRRVDELSIEELERVLAMRKREERQKRLARHKRSGRVIEPKATPPQTVKASAPEPEPAMPDEREAQATLDDIVANIAANPSEPQAARKAPANPRPVIPQSTAPRIVEEEPRPIQVQASPEATKQTRRQRRRVLNGFLTFVEIAAVVGLLYLGYEMLLGIDLLEDRTAEAQLEIEEARARTIPTLEPTPVLAINQVVLPGGHQFVEGQTPQLNIEEIPENVRFAVADQILRPVINRPPRTEETALRVTIPKLQVDQTIVQGADWEALKQGVGQVINGYDPGDGNGNVALTAHNDIYGELFKDLDQLQPGDQFEIQTESSSYLYEVTGFDIVEPTQVEVLQSTGRPTAVLISCYPYRVNSHRIVVFADRLS